MVGGGNAPVELGEMPQLKSKLQIVLFHLVAESVTGNA